MALDITDWPWTAYATDIFIFWQKHRERAFIPQWETVKDLKERWAADCGPFEAFKAHVAEMYPHCEFLDEAEETTPVPTEVRWRLQIAIRAWTTVWRFEHLSENEAEDLLCAYYELKDRAYRRIVEAEGDRLNCDADDVFPSRGDGMGPPEARFGALPSDLLRAVFREMEVYDVSVAMCVCQRWRAAGLDYLRTLKTAEHALTTHLLSRSQWREPEQDFSGAEAYEQWQRVGNQLTQWLTPRCSSLETLILAFPVSRPILKALLQNCTRLRNLIVSPDGTLEPTGDPDIVDEFYGTNLKSLIVMNTQHPVEPSAHRLSVQIPEELSVLSLAESLLTQLAATPLFPPGQSFRDWLSTDLVALELCLPPNELLADFASLPELKLRYLRLEADSDPVFDDDAEVGLRLVEKCSELQVLVLGDYVPFSDAALRQLSLSCPRLERAWLPDNHISSQFTPSTVSQLQQRLIQRGIDPEGISIVALKNEIEQLQEHAPQLSYLEVNYQSILPQELSLASPSMRRLLNLGF